MKFGKTMRQIQEATQDRPFFPIDWAYFRLIMRGIFITGDTVKIRALMAFASLGWVILICFEPHMFERHGYEFMSLVRWPRVIWGGLFFFHGAGALWRIFERKTRVKLAHFINFIGFITWSSTTIAINMAVGTIAAGTALEGLACLFFAFATARTGLNREGVTD